MTRKLIIALAIVFTLAPFGLLALGAMSSDAGIARLDFSEVSTNYLIENLQAVSASGIVTAIWNTVWIAIPMVVMQVISSILAAFAFSQFNFRGKKILFAVLVSSYLLPAVVTLLPLFFLMTAAGLKGSPLGILLPFALFSPYAIVLLRERFEAVPREILDQARVDGLSAWGLLLKVFLPLTRGFVALLAVITFVSTWDSYLWPRLIAGSEFPLINVAIAGLQSQYDSHWNLVLTATLLAVLPAIAALFAAKKNLLRNPIAEIEI